MTPLALTIRQVAELLQVSPDTVYRLAGGGELDGRKIGRIWRFQRKAVERYMNGDPPRGRDAPSLASRRQG